MVNERNWVLKSKMICVLVCLCACVLVWCVFAGFVVYYRYMHRCSHVHVCRYTVDVDIDVYIYLHT